MRVPLPRPPVALRHSGAMALTHVDRAVRLRLPRWDDHLAKRLEQARIEAPDAPAGFRNTPLEVTLTVGAESDAEACARISAALRGWTVLLPSDFHGLTG